MKRGICYLFFTFIICSLNAQELQGQFAGVNEFFNKAAISFSKEEGGTFRVAVGDFPCNNKDSEGMSTASRLIHDKIAEIVSDSDKIELVTRKKLSDLLNEKKLQSLDLLDPNTPAGEVQVKAIQAIVRGHYFFENLKYTVSMELVSLSGGSVRMRTFTIPSKLIPTTDVYAMPPNKTRSKRNAKFVNNVKEQIPTGKIKLDLWVKSGRTDFMEGEKISLKLRSDKTCHIAVFCHQVDENIIQIFPNSANTDTKIIKDKVYEVPGLEKDGFCIEIAEPFGGDIVQVIACTDKNELKQILLDQNFTDGAKCKYSYSSRGDFKTRGMKIIEKKKASLLDLAQNEASEEVVWGEKHITINTFPNK